MQQKPPDTNFVPPLVRVGGKRPVIAEAPGSTESERLEPLCGGAGSWLRGKVNESGKRTGGIIGEAGLNDEDISYANVINCRPPNNLFPTDVGPDGYISKAEAQVAGEHCRSGHLWPMLRSRKWERLDLLGDKPLRFLGRKGEGIKKWRGSPLRIEGLNDNKPIAIPTYHPAYVARDQSVLPIVVHDLQKGLVCPPEYYSPTPTVEEVRAFNFKKFAFDIETEGFSRRVKMVGLCARPYFALAVPFRGEYLVELRRIFREASEIIGHNSTQFDLPILAEHNVVPGVETKCWDTMLMHHLRFPDFDHDLEFVGTQFTSKPAWKGEKGSLEWYCCRDT